MDKLLIVFDRGKFRIWICLHYRLIFFQIQLILTQAPHGYTYQTASSSCRYFYLETGTVQEILEPGVKAPGGREGPGSPPWVVRIGHGIWQWITSNNLIVGSGSFPQFNSPKKALTENLKPIIRSVQ
jgi:hypothetical protein